MNASEPHTPKHLRPEPKWRRVLRRASRGLLGDTVFVLADLAADFLPLPLALIAKLVFLIQLK